MRGSQHIVLMRNKNDPSSIIKYSLLSRALFIYGNSESKADKILFCLRSKVQIISYLNEKKKIFFFNIKNKIFITIFIEIN